MSSGRIATVSTIVLSVSSIVDCPARGESEYHRLYRICIQGQKESAYLNPDSSPALVLAGAPKVCRQFARDPSNAGIHFEQEDRSFGKFKEDVQNMRQQQQEQSSEAAGEIVGDFLSGFLDGVGSGGFHVQHASLVVRSTIHPATIQARPSVVMSHAAMYPSGHAVSGGVSG